MFSNICIYVYILILYKFKKTYSVLTQTILPVLARFKQTKNSYWFSQYLYFSRLHLQKQSAFFVKWNVLTIIFEINLGLPNWIFHNILSKEDLILMRNSIQIERYRFFLIWILILAFKNMENDKYTKAYQLEYLQRN